MTPCSPPRDKISRRDKDSFCPYAEPLLPTRAYSYSTRLLIIAHRLSTIQDADLIVVMDKGRIAETGSHEELIKKKGKYYELYMTQFEGNAI